MKKDKKSVECSSSQQGAKNQEESKNLLSQFWSLASFDNKARVDSVIAIIKELKSSENQVFLI